MNKYPLYLNRLLLLFLKGCADGFYGSDCSLSCNNNCVNKACKVTTAACTFGCQGSMYYGPTCNSACNANCLGGICSRAGYCLSGCNVGFYGDQCQLTCQSSSKCNDGICGRVSGICDDCQVSPPSVNCPSAVCPAGFAGDACTTPCPSRLCLFNRCDRYSPNHCTACPQGSYGSFCSMTCPNCKSGCNQNTGVCDDGCKDGWYGQTCNQQCRSECASCERNSGECVTCIAGRWGLNCQQSCSAFCQMTVEQGVNMLYCDKTTGACRQGVCQVGYWRADCTQACHTHCLTDNNGNRVCEILDGRCTFGCKDTFYGTVCNETCSIRCKNRMCKNYANNCDLGCADGYYGDSCSGTCSSHCGGDKKCFANNRTFFSRM
ncbi:multiple epidermal growth factor-like domains protein 6 [Dreissena polymorpha]|uniref:multiple epidermal growth factor-like domains protein 6 n=1 Tax=Dreissena polymorpha TaxID=45954 RepID=UPI002263C927|nr:multiple epidermal growth factor-like domains protein 6 [Dreissena polymorpha]